MILIGYFFLKMIETVDPLKRFIWTNVLPFICLLGVLVNLLNARIFANRKILKHEIYRYLNAHSIVEAFLLLFALAYFILFKFYYGLYFMRVYQLTIQHYFTSALALLLVFIEFIITIKRLLMIFNLNLTINVSFKMTIFIYFIICLILHLPILFALRIVEREEISLLVANNQTTSNNLSRVANESSLYAKASYQIYYRLLFDKYENFGIIKVLVSIPCFIRGLILPPILLVANLIILIEFRKRSIKKNSKSGSEERCLRSKKESAASQNIKAKEILHDSKKNLTRLIISVNFLFIISNLSAAIVILTFTFTGFTSRVTNQIGIFFNLTFYISHSLNFLVYFLSDELFRKAL